jgi:TRAP-type C4-dicarboxylate transport system permease small subunit
MEETSPSRERGVEYARRQSVRPELVEGRREAANSAVRQAHRERVEATNPGRERMEETSPSRERMEETNPSRERGVEYARRQSVRPELVEGRREAANSAVRQAHRERMEETSPGRERMGETSPSRERMGETSPSRERMEETSPSRERGSGMRVLVVARRGLEAILVAASLALAIAITGIVLYAIALRTFGQAPIWYDEVATIVLCWLTYFGAALAAIRRGHLGSPEIVRRLPAGPRLVLFLLAEAVVIGFFLLLAWYGWQVVDLLAGETLISLPWVTSSATRTIIPLGAILFVLAQILSMPQEWRNLAAASAPKENI